MYNRSRKTSDSKQQYMLVLYGFVAVCILTVIFTVLNPKKNFKDIKIIDESAMLVHNG